MTHRDTQWSKTLANYEAIYYLVSYNSNKYKTVTDYSIYSWEILKQNKKIIIKLCSERG